MGHLSMEKRLVRCFHFAFFCLSICIYGAVNHQIVKLYLPFYIRLDNFIVCQLDNMMVICNTLEPWLSGLVGTRWNSPDDQESWWSKNIRNISEEQKCLDKAILHCETTLLQIAWKTTQSPLHIESLNSQWASQNSFECSSLLGCLQALLLLFKSKKTLLVTALIDAIVLKRIFLQILVMTNIHDKIGTRQKIWIIKKSG